MHQSHIFLPADHHSHPHSRKDKTRNYADQRPNIGRDDVAPSSGDGEHARDGKESERCDERRDAAAKEEAFATGESAGRDIMAGGREGGVAAAVTGVLSGGVVGIGVGVGD